MKNNREIIVELIAWRIKEVMQSYWDLWSDKGNLKKDGTGLTNKKIDEFWNIIHECIKLYQIIPEYREELMLECRHMDMYLDGLHGVLETNNRLPKSEPEGK
jgi:hypothetical protein